jgi:hypothetical protein
MNKRMGDMNKKISRIAVWIAAFMMISGFLFSDVFNQGQIKRLTHSGSHSVHYPCLDDEGTWMLYIMEDDSGEETIKSIRLMNIDSGKDVELFKDRNKSAPEPYESIPLLIGTKPPLLSGDGRVAFFVLSLDQPENILDHYLAMINTDGTGFRIFSFPIENLQEKEWERLGFKGNEWERISHYSVNYDGSRVACVMKGYLGPVRYGNASAIIMLDTLRGKTATILAPELNANRWEWTKHPSRPLLGGGWAFDINGAGDRVLFGAQTTDDPMDFDLYISDWEGTRIQKITDFHDRWFSLAELSDDGNKVVFYYSGMKNQGIGTYMADSDGSALRHLQEALSPSIAYYDLSGNAKYIVYRLIYEGKFLDCETKEEGIIFDPDTPGYVTGSIPMDFPQFPAFWGPKIMSYEGTRIIIAGIPEGKQSPEFYLLSFENKK